MSLAAHHREFRVENEYEYNRTSVLRWIVSHLLRHKLVFFGSMLTAVVSVALTALSTRLTGRAFDAVLSEESPMDVVLQIVLLYVAVALTRSVFDIVSAYLKEFVAARFQRDVRDELEISLLGKSQTFHNRQRVGDIMARATGDVQQQGMMISPGANLIFDSSLFVIIPLIAIAGIQAELLILPLIYVVVLVIALRHYNNTLNPVAGALQMQYGQMNAGLNESITGIELVKATAQEAMEMRKFLGNAAAHRDYFIKQGHIQALYWPMLYMGIALTLMLGHGLWLVSLDRITLGELVAFMGLAYLLRFPTFISSFTFTLVQMGRAGSERILSIITQDTELDENVEGHRAEIQGRVEFERVGFEYTKGSSTLNDISFAVEPGECLAIVGQTGAGKSTITKLVNRIFDSSEGRILIDGHDVRAWNLASLRSQISIIEQDIFLYSRTLAENIGFGLGRDAPMERIEAAARSAQADEFIRSFRDGYQTVIGERGVTLSGGQRQRIAIARALLTNPRILIIDDSTSAIDSATEDEIQRAINSVMEGRTTFLITHRIAQIRKADRILVLSKGNTVDLGTHDELMSRCRLYRYIFLRGEDSLYTDMVI